MVQVWSNGGQYGGNPLSVPGCYGIGRGNNLDRTSGWSSPTHTKHTSSRTRTGRLYGLGSRTRTGRLYGLGCELLSMCVNIPTQRGGPSLSP